LNASVCDSGGRTESVYPGRQMVEPMVAWVMAGSIAPGVQERSGSSP
jgi:hypothetical protein